MFGLAQGAEAWPTCKHLQAGGHLDLGRRVITRVGNKFPALGLDLRPEQPVPHPVDAGQRAEVGRRGHALLGEEPCHRDINGDGRGEGRRCLQRLQGRRLRRDWCRPGAAEQLVVTNGQFPELRPAILVQSALGDGGPFVVHRPPGLGRLRRSLDDDLLAGEKDVARVSGQRYAGMARAFVSALARSPGLIKSAQDSGQYPYSSHHASTPAGVAAEF